MSIRLRLTLVYSAILTLTLFAFGVMLYVRQVQETIDIEKQFLIGMGERFADGRRVPPGSDPARQPPPVEPLPPPDSNPPEELPDGGSSAPPDGFAGGYLVRRSPDGQEILDLQTPDDVVLPLSEDASRAAQNGETWMELATVEGERFLIYTVPIVMQGRVVEILQMGRSLTTRDQSINALGVNLLIAGLLAIAVAFGLGWVLAGISLRPIHRLTQTAQAIGAERDFSRRVEHTGPEDEVGRLARTFNSMLSELQAAYNQVEQTLELQRRFVADVSHELRTPLTTLSGNVELLRREPPISPRDRSAVLSDMASESNRLIRLVNDLLVLARADARRPFKREPVPVKPITEEVCRQARLLAPGREITCLPLPDKVAWAQADALKQVLLILLDNAIKHADGPVAVSAKIEDPYIVITVRDSGPGIEPDLVPHVFERFSQVQVPGDDHGIGLGLSIAKALVEGQDGTISVQSRPGQGSAFSVSLKRATSPDESQPASRQPTAPSA